MPSKLKEILVLEGITPAELAKESGLNAATISKILNDKNYNPKDVTKGKIAKAINSISKKNTYVISNIAWGKL